MLVNMCINGQRLMVINDYPLFSALIVIVGYSYAASLVQMSHQTITTSKNLIKIIQHSLTFMINQLTSLMR